MEFRLYILLLATLVFTCEIWTANALTSEQGFKQFKTKLDKINANNLALMVLVKEKTQTNQTSLEVVQVWQNYYSGGLKPFDLVPIECSEDEKCKSFTLDEEYFVILGSSDDTSEKTVIAHFNLPNNSMSSRNKFIRMMTATACGSMGCIIDVASYPPERNQILDYEQGPRLTVWCPGKKDVQWFCKYTPSSDSTWNKVDGSSGMRVGKNNQHQLKIRGHLLNEHTDYEYECRDIKTLNDNPITKFLLQIGKQIQNSNEYCKCKNGGTCLEDGTCQCKQSYGGQLCDKTHFAMMIGDASQVLSTNAVYIICAVVSMLFFLCVILSWKRRSEYSEQPQGTHIVRYESVTQLDSGNLEKLPTDDYIVTYVTQTDSGKLDEFKKILESINQSMEEHSTDDELESLADDYAANLVRRRR